MNMKILSYAGVLVIGLIIGLACGKTVFKPSGNQVGDSDPISSRVRARERDRTIGKVAALSGMEKIRQSQPAGLADLTRMAVTTGDPVEGQRLLSECLLHMTAENWKEVVASFDKVSTETGRDPGNEWKLALFRGGQIAGEEAMNSYLSGGLKNKKTESWQVLYGWGSKDPRGALAWLRKAEADGNEISAENYNAVIAGTALGNPNEALALLGELSPQHQQGVAGHLVWNTIQNGGIDALDSVIRYASKLDVSAPGAAALSAGLLDEAAEKLLWKADHARDVGQAVDAINKLTEYGQDPNRVTRQALSRYRYYSMPDKLNLLDAVSAAPDRSGLDLPSLTSTVMNGLNEGNGDVAAIRNWITGHPSSPLVPYLKERVKD